MKPKNEKQPKTWRKVKLGEVLELKYGFGLPETKRKTGRVPVFGSSGIVGAHNEAAVQSQGIVIGRKGHVGSIHYSNVPFYPIDTVYYVDQLKIPGDIKFFYYFLKRIPFQQIGSDVGVPGLNRDIAYGLEVKIPEDPNIQKRIADVLSAFDDKIELNNKISKNLEAMAQAIFKEWFVKFKFPDHKKAKFVDSELGKIPKGWEVKNLGDILVLEYGEALTSINRKKGVIPVYGSSGLVGYHDKKLVNGPGIIIGRAGIPGSVYWSQVDFHCVDSTFYVETKISKYFVFYLLKRQNLKSLISGSAVPGINRNIIYPNRIVLPLPSIINDFEKIMSPIFLKIYKNKLENQKLASLRDLLLPKLMSGKILVKS